MGLGVESVLQPDLPQDGEYQGVPQGKVVVADAQCPVGPRYQQKLQGKPGQEQKPCRANSPTLEGMRCNHLSMQEKPGTLLSGDQKSGMCWGLSPWVLPAYQRQGFQVEKAGKAYLRGA